MVDEAEDRYLMAFKKLPSGTGSLIIGSLLFIVVGGIVLLNRTSFEMSGGNNRFGAPTMTTSFSGGETQVFGGVFIGLGILLAYFAYRYSKK